MVPSCFHLLLFKSVVKTYFVFFTFHTYTADVRCTSMSYVLRSLYIKSLCINKFSLFTYLVYLQCQQKVFFPQLFLLITYLWYIYINLQTTTSC
jgi:hypothetical protein